MSINKKGGNAIVGLLLAHGEKLGIGVVALLAGWLLYASLGFEGVTKTPDELNTLATAARQRIENDFSWSDAVEEPEGALIAKNFRAISSTSVRYDDYKIASQGWNGGVVDKVALRPDPPLLAVVDMACVAGTELMGFVDEDFRQRQTLESQREERRKQVEREKAREAGNNQNKPDRPVRIRNNRNGGATPDENDRREVMSYVVVLAKVPVLDQTQAYWKAFSGALGFDRRADQPEYLGYYVERRPVLSSGPGEWEPIDLRNGYNRERLEAVDSLTIEKSKFDWIETLSEIADTEYTHEVLTFPLPPIIGRDWRRQEVVHADVPLQSESDAFDEDRGFDERLDRDRRGRSFTGGPVEVEVFEPQDEVEMLYPQPHLMLRFFDLSVEPGKQYQYRVRLVLEDPNGETPRNILAKEAIERLDKENRPLGVTRFRLGPWSEAGPVVSVPQAGGVLLASITPGRKGAYNTEPSVEMVVDSFDTQEGKPVSSALKKRLYRGGVANFIEKDVKFIQAQFLETAEEYTFRTDVTVLDMIGGEPVTRDMSTPAEVLVMDASGRMSVRREVADADEATETIARYEGEENKGNRRKNDFLLDDFVGEEFF